MTEASQHYQTGLDLKVKGDIDQALTWFRRAAISDPSMAAAHMEIGRICRTKSRQDPMFSRYALEAFRSAARLELGNAEAHDQYIMMAQQMKILDQIHDEYENWSKQYPQNEVIQRAYKNLVAISMAMFSTQAEVGGAQASGTMKKMILLTSFLMMLIGAGMIFVPPMLVKSGKVQKSQLKSFVFFGIVLGGAGLGGFIFRRRLD